MAGMGQGRIVSRQIVSRSGIAQLTHRVPSKLAEDTTIRAPWSFMLSALARRTDRLQDQTVPTLYTTNFPSTSGVIKT